MGEGCHEDEVLNEGVVGGDLVGGEGGEGLEEDVSSPLEVTNGHEVDGLVGLKSVSAVPVSSLLYKTKQRIRLSPRSPSLSLVPATQPTSWPSQYFL